MTMLCRAMQRETNVQLVGLCHSVQGLGGKLGRWIGAPQEEILCECAGINHQAWALRFERNGQDAYPKLREGGGPAGRSTGRTRCGSRCSRRWGTT